MADTRPPLTQAFDAEAGKTTVPETPTFEVSILVDNIGDYAVGKDDADAKEKYEEQIQALSDADGFRIVRISLSVPLPEVVEIVGDVPVVLQPGPLTFLSPEARNALGQ